MEFHQKDLMRSLIPKEKTSEKEIWDYINEKRNFMLEYQRQKEEEKQLENEIENKLSDCVEQALSDLLKGFNGNINVKL